jgi:hypothetical protein
MGKSLPKLPMAVENRIPNARMPLNYVAAKNAVAKCIRLDECKDWSDKTMALASYARQIKDDELEKNAKRLRLRAQVRMGELLLELDAPHGGWPGPDGKMTNTRGTSERYKTGLDAGLSRAIINRTVSMARVDEAKREAVIEADPPISCRALSDLGRVRKFKTGREVGAAYKELVNSGWGANLGRFHAWIKGKSAAFIGSQITANDEIDRLRKLIVDCQEWLDELDQVLHSED